ncbi:MAG: glycosyltransferase family 4 protein [Lachnospiraceae bacterium]|jgi:glycosyltransferase involved in cell wall biosynthesis|nr:glycosyltransferase family 4 protein [Lachnospiraceae bacterium]
MDKKYRILLVHNRYQIQGGEDTVFENEKRMLEQNGHRVVTYIRSNEEIKNMSIRQKLFLPFRAVFSVKTYREVKRLIRKEKIDIVHVHNTLTMVSPSVFYAAFSEKIPVVQTVHNFRMVCPNALFYRDGHNCEECVRKGLQTAIRHKCYRNSTAQTLISVMILKFHRMLGTYRKVYFICLTEFSRGKLLQGSGNKIFDAKKVYVKPNFVDIDRKIIPFAQRKPQFIYVGRPETIKGMKILLETWKNIPEYDLIICGVSEELEYFKQMAADAKLDNVRFWGKVENDKVKELLAQSLAMIHPTQLYEGFPMTIAESLACGTPVIGSDLGNVGNLVKDGVTGLRFRHDSSKDLYDKIHALTDMTESSVQVYREHYTQRANYERLMKIYREICKV